jgi:hypothetical protein
VGAQGMSKGAIVVLFGQLPTSPFQKHRANLGFKKIIRLELDQPKGILKCQFKCKETWVQYFAY